MKTKLLLLFIPVLFASQVIVAQAPVLYINFVTHNEPGDNLQNPFNFNKSKNYVQQLAAIMDTKGASWNLETCDGFANGALNLEGASSNIFRTLSNFPYDDNIEIDPRNKNMTNIADLYHTLDSLGANPTNTLGGFLYKITPPATGSPDWFQYQDTITGITYPWAKWKCNLIWGAGSLDPHTADLNDYGIWKPDSTNTFYTHNPGASRTLWYIGNGCQPDLALDSTDNEQAVIDFVQAVVDSIQTIWPQNKFYNYTITFNQSQFGPMLFNKITKIIDSVDAIGTSKIQWKTLTEKFSAFQSWQIATGNAYSQWNCGDVATGLKENNFSDVISISPNPSGSIFTIRSNNKIKNVEVFDITGKIIFQESLNNETFKTLNLHTSKNGIYLIRINTNEGVTTKRIILNQE